MQNRERLARYLSGLPQPALQRLSRRLQGDPAVEEQQIPRRDVLRILQSILGRATPDGVPLRGPGTPGVVLIVTLVLVTIISQFFRISTGVVAPQLQADLGMTASQLGIAAGAFYFSAFLMQLPIGVMYDRYGVRNTLATLLSIVVVGGVGHALAPDALTLTAARFVMGLGCAGCFMGVIVLCSRWYPPTQVTTLMSFVYAFSNIGSVLAATPYAIAAEMVGWRAAIWAMTVWTAVIAVVVMLIVRERPPGVVAPERPRESMRQILDGYRQVWRIRSLFNICTVHLFVYSSAVTLIGTWASLYLFQVYGLEGEARGNVQGAMAIAQVLGLLCYGPLDRVYNSRKWVVVGGAVLSLNLIAMLALLPTPPLWMTVVLLVGYCFVTTYNVVIIAHGRSLFPDRLAGRGTGTLNFAQVGGATALPVLTGYIVGFFTETEGAIPEYAFRAAFGFMGIMLFLGLLFYLRAPDAKPRDQIVGR